MAGRGPNPGDRPGACTPGNHLTLDLPGRSDRRGFPHCGGGTYRAGGVRPGPRSCAAACGRGAGCRLACGRCTLDALRPHRATAFSRIPEISPAAARRTVANRVDAGAAVRGACFLGVNGAQLLLLQPAPPGAREGQQHGRPGHGTGARGRGARRTRGRGGGAAGGEAAAPAGASRRPRKTGRTADRPETSGQPAHCRLPGAAHQVRAGSPFSAASIRSCESSKSSISPDR